MHFSHTFKITLIFFSILNLYAGCNEKEKEPVKPSYVTQVTLLPEELSENSGMIWYQGLIWTINDSGREPLIYIIDTTGKIIRHIRLDGVENTDWEEIAQDESYIYVGDFGNNEGARKDLRIYMISKNNLADTMVTPVVIHFAFADQTDFTPDAHNTPYDCEAMVCRGDSIYLFTKNWTGDSSRIYSIPAVEGDYQAIPCGYLNAGGQVTASVYSDADKRLYILGYADFIPFLLVCHDFSPGEAYTGPMQQHLFPEKIGMQTEGIVLTDKGDILISCEQGLYSAAILRVTLGDLP